MLGMVTFMNSCEKIGITLEISLRKIVSNSLAEIRCFKVMILGELLVFLVRESLISFATSTGNSASSLVRKTKDNRLERSRGGVRPPCRLPLTLIGRTPATGPGWPLTPATRSPLSSGIAVLVASWYNTAQLPPAVASSSPLVVHARVTVYYTHLSWSWAAARWERNSVRSDKQLPPSGLIAAN